MTNRLNNSKYKVREVVYVKSFQQLRNEGAILIDNMIHCAGQPATITKVEYSLIRGSYIYLIKEDLGEHYWVENMFTTKDRLMTYKIEEEIKKEIGL